LAYAVPVSAVEFVPPPSTVPKRVVLYEGVDTHDNAEVVAPVGDVVSIAPILLSSFAALLFIVGPANEISISVDIPARTGGVERTEIEVTPSSALAGATAVNTPKPKAETATSAMRLRVVFVDICFLSIVDPRAFPESAW